MLNIHFDPFPVLSTQRLDLRKVTLDDAQEYFVLRSDKRVMEFMDKPLMSSAEEAAKMIQKIHDDAMAGEGITWAICLKDSPKLIGTIGFWKITKEHHRAEIGYLLHPDHWRKGLVQEALAPVLKYGFGTMMLHSVEANVNPANLPSIRFLEKNGFVREAYFKENYYFNGQFLDSAIYSMLAHDFENK